MQSSRSVSQDRFSGVRCGDEVLDSSLQIVFLVSVVALIMFEEICRSSAKRICGSVQTAVHRSTSSVCANSNRIILKTFRSSIIEFSFDFDDDALDCHSENPCRRRELNTNEKSLQVHPAEPPDVGDRRREFAAL